MSIYDNVTDGLKWLISGNIRISSLKMRQLKPHWKTRHLGWRSKDRLHDSAIGLSGGQQQQVCVAQVRYDQSKLFFWMNQLALDPISAGKIEETLYGLKTIHHALGWHAPCNKQSDFYSISSVTFLNGDLISTMTPMKCSWTQLRKKQKTMSLVKIWMGRK